MLNTKDDDGADFFNKFNTPINDRTSLVETALDDSLLDAWKTPEVRAKGQRKPFIPDIVNTIDRSGSSTAQPSRYSNGAWTIDSTERKRQVRRCHQLINETTRVRFINSFSMNSTGLAQRIKDNSSVFNPDGTLNLPKFSSKKTINRRTTLGEEDELEDEDSEEEEYE